MCDISRGLFHDLGSLIRGDVLDIVVVLLLKQTGKVVNAMGDFVGVEQGAGLDVIGIDHIAQ